MADEVKRGQVRRDGTPTDPGATYKVMVVSDGYAMVRRKAAMPFVIAVKHAVRHPLVLPASKA